jgi:hypothetical protein
VISLMNKPAFASRVCVWIAIAGICAVGSAAASGSPRGCQLSQRDFIGHWQERVAAGEPSDDIQELQFALENGRRIFRSWLHQRPEMFGTWAISNCRVKASGPGDMEMTFRFAANDKRRLIEIDSGVTYRRMR